MTTSVMRVATYNCIEIGFRYSLLLVNNSGPTHLTCPSTSPFGVSHLEHELTTIVCLSENCGMTKRGGGYFVKGTNTLKCNRSTIELIISDFSN